MAQTETAQLTPDAIREAFKTRGGRARDVAEALGLREAQLVAAHIGQGTTAIAAHPDRLIPAIERLGTCMALTRNASCVIEKDGVYSDYHPGEHAAMTLNPDIDMRLFPKHWVHGFLQEQETETGIRRSVQVFDAAGDAVHKTYLREGSDLAAWAALKADLALPEQRDVLEVEDRTSPEGAKSDPSKRDLLLKEWQRLTDTHQFLRLCAKFRMNRLGAYRIAGEPFVRALAPAAVPELLKQAQESATQIMVFVGNRGCIEIHSGPVHTLKAMGPWENVLDPGFNLHLRQDHVAEVWAVEKPTKRGAAISVEAFDAEGNLIVQFFPVAKDDNDHRPAWKKIVAGLPGLEVPA